MACRCPNHQPPPSGTWLSWRFGCVARIGRCVLAEVLISPTGASVWSALADLLGASGSGSAYVLISRTSGSEVQPTREDAPIYATTLLQPYGPALTKLCWTADLQILDALMRLLSAPCAGLVRTCIRTAECRLSEPARERRMPAAGWLADGISTEPHLR